MILAVALLPIGFAAAWVLGTPLDSFLLAAGTVVLGAATVMVAMRFQGALLGLGLMWLFWFGFAGAHLLG